MAKLETPHPPGFALQPDFAGNMAVRLAKKKFQHLFGSSFKEVRDEFRKELGLGDQQSKELVLYVLQVSRVAINELIDEVEERYSKEK